ncbi:hypothetical protein GCG21_00700 [Pseudactinotalea sp. HY160]|uniref:hypothetical protein n=1 Tax=Pseudactinotalea sp. HY160 TaxID=2654490 RepID=UPI00128B3CD2|nr:hypothetical protein [Pseudactinotalea sp. HY160]MPV48552.1 hypothetical protein [Pseudactinotalea sp. HY160]
MNRRHPGEYILAAVVMSWMFVLAACSAGAEGGPRPDDPGALRLAGESFLQSGGDPEVARVFEDGVIDREDYEFVFSRYQSCIEAAGMSLRNVAINPLDSLTYSYMVHYNSLSEEDGWSESIRCDREYLETPQSWYQETNPAEINPKLIVPIHACLDRVGVDYDPEASTLRGLFLAEDPTYKQFETVSECAVEAMTEKFPEVTGYGVEF